MNMTHVSEEARPVPRRSPLNRKRLRGLIQVAVSLLILTLILRRINWLDVRDTLWHINLAGLWLAWGLFLLGIVVRAGRWQVLLNALGVRRPLSELASWYFVGSFFNVLLPTGFGGDAVRVVELAQDTSRPGPVLNSVLVDRYMGIMVLLAMGLTAGLLSPGVASTEVLALTGLLFGGGLLAGWLVRERRWAGLAQRPGVIGKVVQVLRLPVLSEAVALYSGAALRRSLAISFLFNVLQIGWNVVIARSLGLHLPLMTFVIFVPLTAVALLIPAFGGLGMRELSYVGLFSGAGVPTPVALALSLCVYLITLASGLVGGVLYLAQGIRRARQAGNVAS